MGLRFRKSIKLGNLVKLNISKSGLSATIGKSGASVNIGSKGVYANVNPSIAGIKGTGVSYRKKLLSNPFNYKKDSQELKEIKNINDNREIKKEKQTDDNSSFDDLIYIHKIPDNVLNKNEFSNINDLENKDLLIIGDEETVEKEIGDFLDNIDLPYSVSANYELEDKVLLVDLDLPEIELLKTKSISLSKEEYAKTIINLGLYLSINFFNISSYIDEIILSSFISKRNKDGDLVDEYLYSVKFLRDEFEKTDFKKLDDTYAFLLKFDNRINMSDSYSFKAIKPYVLANEILIDEAISGLERLGYNSKDIKGILPTLNNVKLKTTDEYIKEALRLLKK